ncbi:MAG: sigma 54-interacting transcriptional regulator [Deltaproteobacteria bacterium]|nr:sigma 54-interacting transcriptional regulator [Deltaproteobacteria bacterium]
MHAVEEKLGTGGHDPDVILSLSALFEGPFSIDWLQEMADFKASHILLAMDKGIRDHLLERLETGVFQFREPAMRNRLRSLLPPRERERWHQRAARVIISTIKEQPEAIRALASHLMHIANDPEGCGWLSRAADEYLREFQYEDALRCYTKIIADLAAQSGTEVDRLFIDAAIRYSKISTATHDPKRVITVLLEALERAKASNDLPSQVLLHMHLAKNNWLRSHYGIAMRHFDHGWKLVSRVDDERVVRSSTTFSAFFLYWQGRYKEAVEVYEQSVPEIHKFPRGTFPLLAAIIVGQCYCKIGQLSQGLGMMDAIRTRCLEKGDKHSASYASAGMGECLLQVGEVDRAMTYLRHTLQEAGSGHNQWAYIMGNACLAHAYLLSGKKDQAVSFLRKYLKQSRRARIEVRPFPSFMDLCWAIEEGRLPRVRGLSLEKEIVRNLQGRNVFMQGIAYRHRAWLKMKRHADPALVLGDLESSLECLEASGHILETARANLELGRTRLLAGKDERAKTMVVNACRVIGKTNDRLIPEELRHLAKDCRAGDNLLKEILRLGQEVVGIRDPKELATHVISTVNRITGAERGAIFVLDPASTPPRLELRAARNLTAEEVASERFELSMKLIRETAGSGKTLIHAADPPDEIGTLASGRIRSCVCVPMILRNHCVGVLYHDNRLFGSVFKESDLEFLSYFAGQAAIALDNATAYEKIRKINRKLLDEKRYYEEQHLESIHFEDFVGRSPAIVRVMELVERVSRTATTALILGETGVGKELVARAIHRNSQRRTKSFIRVHCSALPRSLITSELFGHEKGAFTGASERRIGRFELADGGTLFLDEVGDIPPDVQVRLLRVLQSGEFERVGGSRTLRSDFRLIAATNRDLRQAVAAGRFREDLYYRLNVFPIFVPPLRERKEDIPLLAHYFLRLYSTRMAKPVQKIPDTEMEKLVAYDWPGNVRELENVVERGTILSTGPYFRVPELQTDSPKSFPRKWGTTLQDNERFHILWALEKTAGKIRGPGGAARLLDIHPNTLYSRMKKLGIRKTPMETGSIHGTVDPDKERPGAPFSVNPAGRESGYSAFLKV